MGLRLIWRGTEVLRKVQTNVEDAYGEFGLHVERYAKKELSRGHGVLTGTLRRSIHTADASYDWGSDDVTASKSSPERGGQAVKGESVGATVTLLIGSGLKYALPVHQGHHSFAGYHYLTNGLAKAKPELDGILRKYRMKK